MRTCNRAIFISFFIFLFTCNCIVALEYQYGLNANYRLSDNILESMPATSGSIVNTGFSFNLTEREHKDWFVQARGTFNHEEFSVDQVRSRNRKSFSGRFEYNPSSNNFSLIVLDELSEVPEDRFNAQSDLNVRETNVLSVIPSYVYNMSALDRLNFRGNYVKTKNNGAQNGNQANQIINASQESKSYSAEYERQLNSTNQLFTIYSKTMVAFDSGNGIDYDLQNLLLRWVINGRATGVQLEFGRSEIEDVNSNVVGLNTYRATVRRIINSSHSFVIDIRKAFDSEIETNSVNNSVDIGDAANNLIRAQIIKSSNLRYEINTESLVASVSIFQNETRDAVGISQEEQVGYTGSLSYPISRLFFGNDRSQLQLNFSDSKNTFDSNTNNFQAFENRVRLQELIYSHNYNDKLSFYLVIQNQELSGGRLNSGSLQGDSKSISIGFNYSSNNTN